MTYGLNRSRSVGKPVDATSARRIDRVPRELELPDPRTAWQEESERGLASGVDEVFHFFFDDNDFDQTAIGVTLLNPFEVAAIEKLKSSLEAVLDSVGDRDDDAFVEHPLWRQVTAAAADARCHLQVA
jgi:hypothetical protein